MQSTKDKEPNSWALPDPSSWAPWCQPRDCFETKMQKERILFLLFLLFCSLSPTTNYEPKLCDPLDPHRGGDTVLEAQAYCVFVSASLGIKATFLFPPKNIYFHKGIRFLYSCSFYHCFKKVNSSIFWKEENLVINADYRWGTAKVEKESKDQREKTVSYFTAA